MTRYDVLKKALNMAYHNLFCYSKNYAMTKPKEGFEKEWEETNEEAEILTSMIKECV